MERNSTETIAHGTALFAGDAWFDPIEAGIRNRVRGFIEELLEQELTAALGRGRSERAGGEARGYRNGTGERDLLGSFGPATSSVPRARMAGADGSGTQEWRSATLPRYGRMTKQVEALSAGAYLSGTNTRRVKRALAALFGGAVGQDVLSRTWRKVRTDWDAWAKRDLAGEGIVRLILDGAVVRVRLDRRATSLSLLVVLGVRRDGQKVLLSIKNMGGESEAAWRAVLDDLASRGLPTPTFLITDGAPGLERALAAMWPDVPAQRCSVHKHRNLLAHAPDKLHDEISTDYTDMIDAETAKAVQVKRRAFLREWRLRCPAVAARLEEAGDRLFAFLRLPPSQWKSARTTNAIKRLHEEFRRRIKTQTVLPSAETAALLFWALLASGQITMRKVNGWQTLAEPLTDVTPVDLVALIPSERRHSAYFHTTRYGTLREFRQAFTRLDTPPLSDRRHPVSAIALERARSDGSRPERTRSTIWRRNSGEYGGWVFGMTIPSRKRVGCPSNRGNFTLELIGDKPPAEAKACCHAQIEEPALPG